MTICAKYKYLVFSSWDRNTRMLDYIKSSIIQAWAMGKQRDSIASEFNVATGTVSNIISEWKNRIGYYDADSIRELAIGMKNAEITPEDCLTGLRISCLIDKFGIDPEQFEYFLNKTYDECIAQGVRPQDLARLVKEINSLQRISYHSINDIPKIIKERLGEKRKLDFQIYKKRNEINNLNDEKVRREKDIEDLQNQYESCRQKNKDQEKNFLLLEDMKDELQKNNIPIQFLKPMINLMTTFRNDFNFHPMKIFDAFINIGNYQLYCKDKNNELKEIDSRVKRSEAMLARIVEDISSYQIKELAQIELENMEFDSSDFKRLYQVIQKIADDYGRDKGQVKTILFGLLYEIRDLFRLQKMKVEKQDEISVLDKDITSKRDILSAQLKVFSIFKFLLENAVTEDQILSMLNVFIKDFQNQKTRPSNINEYLEGLSKDLEKNQTVKNTLRSLNFKVVFEESKINRLSTYKSNLESFIYLSVIAIYIHYILLKLRNRQMQKRSIEILSGQYVWYLLLFYYVTKASTIISKTRINAKNKNGKKIAKRKKNKDNTKRIVV